MTKVTWRSSPNYRFFYSFTYFHKEAKDGSGLDFNRLFIYLY